MRATIVGAVMALLCMGAGQQAGAQTADTLEVSQPLFTRGDALIAAGFTAAAIVAAPADRLLTRGLREDSRQASPFLRRGATAFRIWGNPGAFAAGVGIYVFGTLQDSRRTQDLGLHAVESVVLANMVTFSMKVIAGRARPHADSMNAANFELFRGLKSDDYRSFPSAHSTAAFAFAAIVTSETSHWRPANRWIVGPAMYGAATLAAFSRMYDNQHWASDVITGAAIGTLTGLKVFRYQHSHPDNTIDNWLLRAGLQTSGGRWNVVLAAVPR